MIIAAISLLLFCSRLHAQDITIHNGNGPVGGADQLTTFVDFPKADQDLVTKRWISYLKHQGGKFKSSKGEYFLDNAEIKSISPDTLDIFSRVEDGGDYIRVIMAVNRNGAFINNANAANPAVEQFLYAFAVEMKKEMAAAEVEAAEKILKKLRTEANYVTDENQKLEKNIEEYKSKISDAERDIQSNKTAIQQKEDLISKQEEVVKQLKEKLKSVE